MTLYLKITTEALSTSGPNSMLVSSNPQYFHLSAVIGHYRACTKLAEKHGVLYTNIIQESMPRNIQSVQLLEQKKRQAAVVLVAVADDANSGIQYSLKLVGDGLGASA